MSLGNRRLQACEAVLGLAVALVCLPACGYHIAGSQVGLPPEVRTLGVGSIANFSREYGLEKVLAFAMEREIAIRRQLRFSNDPAAADALLNGTIRDVNVRPVAFDSTDRAVQYEIGLTLDVTLIDQRDGRVLWQATGLRDTDEYSASPNVVVTSSSQFQQGTLDAADIQNPQFTTIQLAETLRRQAINRLIAQMARTVYEQMVEDF
jgi:outer membrane lipopolysaccharide assembly protein LptE/RlpB